MIPKEMLGFYTTLRWNVELFWKIEPVEPEDNHGNQHVNPHDDTPARQSKDDHAHDLQLYHISWGQWGYQPTGKKIMELNDAAVLKMISTKLAKGYDHRYQDNILLHERLSQTLCQQAPVIKKPKI